MENKREREIFKEGSMNCPAIIPGPFKIVSLSVGSNDILSGWLESQGEYGQFWANWYHATALRFDKMQYRDLDHFAGVLGKFDPYAVCLAEPVEIEQLGYRELLKIKELFE